MRFFAEFILSQEILRYAQNDKKRCAPQDDTSEGLRMTCKGF